jgi:hypothetical protein
LEEGFFVGVKFVVGVGGGGGGSEEALFDERGRLSEGGEGGVEAAESAFFGAQEDGGAVAREGGEFGGASGKNLFGAEAAGTASVGDKRKQRASGFSKNVRSGHHDTGVAARVANAFEVAAQEAHHGILEDADAPVGVNAGLGDGEELRLSSRGERTDGTKCDLHEREAVRRVERGERGRGRVAEDVENEGGRSGGVAG